MLGFYNYTVILTYIGMLTGFSGITMALMGNTHYALICLMIAGVCDMFDGKIASTMERTDREKAFGIQIDSLSDLICFGVLPAVIVCSRSYMSTMSFCIAGLYVLAALIRLAWFNVDEAERQTLEDSGREIYLGLPVTTAALILPIMTEVMHALSLDPAKAGPFTLLVMGTAFLTPFKVKKPAMLGKISMVILGGLSMVLLFAGFDI